jgi:hypothetical protein
MKCCVISEIWVHQVNLNLLYSFCNNLYGAEFWDLSNSDFECVCVAWRKALKRVYSLLWRTHSNVMISCLHMGLQLVGVY